MRLTMQERRVVTKEYAARYRKAGKKEKGRMLGEFVASTGYNRVYAARLLRGYGARVEVKPGVFLEGAAGTRKRRVRPRKYGPDVTQVLKQVWETMDYICGKRLAAALPEVVPRLVDWGELEVKPDVYEKLLQVSASTIDRLLAGLAFDLEVCGKLVRRVSDHLEAAFELPFPEFHGTNHFLHRPMDRPDQVAWRAGRQE